MIRRTATGAIEQGRPPVALDSEPPRTSRRRYIPALAESLLWATTPDTTVDGPTDGPVNQGTSQVAASGAGGFATFVVCPGS